MWISKKKWRALENRVADLEEQVQGQPEISLVSLKKAFSEYSHQMKSCQPELGGERNVGKNDTIW